MLSEEFLDTAAALCEAMSREVRFQVFQDPQGRWFVVANRFCPSLPGRGGFVSARQLERDTTVTELKELLGALGRVVERPPDEAELARFEALVEINPEEL